MWELRMLCIEGLTPRIHPGNLLTETNASCPYTSLVYVDEKPISSSVLCPRPETKLRFGSELLVSREAIFLGLKGGWDTVV